ncbi:MAG: nucleotide sugar dehydrogenase, partial [Bacteroidota bacterium]
MKISIFGLGYVGSVSAACLAEIGHEVLGVDIMPQKVNPLKEGIPPVKEPRLDELLRKNLDAGRLQFTMDSMKASRNSDCAMIAVGTPSDASGAVNLTALERCVESIASSLLESDKTSFTIIIRSTVPPGTTQRMTTLTQRILQGKCRIHFSMNPEFLREGSAVEDFFHPALIIFGLEEESLKTQLQQIYLNIDAPHVWVDTATAELVKYTNNAFHALKVGFANEIARLAEAYGSDGNKIMELLCADTKLNISAKYLRPGFAFGGSCLPKDLRGINSIAQKRSVDTPLLRSIIPSNDAHLEQCKNQVLAVAKDKVAVLGITFKTGTDDVRESAGLRL